MLRRLHLGIKVTGLAVFQQEASVEKYMHILQTDESLPKSIEEIPYKKAVQLVLDSKNAKGLWLADEMDDLKLVLIKDLS